MTKAKELVRFGGLIVGGLFFLFCSFLFARAGDLGAAVVFAVPSQVLLTAGCVVAAVRKELAEFGGREISADDSDRGQPR